MLIGYARVSTLEQTLALQQDALTKAGCERTFTDTASGSLAARPGLTEALDFARPGDTLVVWRLDRLGRSLRHLLDTVSLLQEQGIGFKSLQEQIDTTTSGTKLVFHVFALDEFERDLVRERTQAGFRAARTRGRLGGRKALDLRKSVSDVARRWWPVRAAAREAAVQVGAAFVAGGQPTVAEQLGEQRLDAPTVAATTRGMPPPPPGAHRSVPCCWGVTE